jgi:ubiquinone/menaquinone biosynthesis C-methylase UbiE
MADDTDRLWVESMPLAYERWLVPTVFQPFAVDLARRIARHRPRHVLELAAGTGVLTRELVSALPSARIVATDLNVAMVDLGRRGVPQASWRQADALSLRFDRGEFDVVVCQFGVMFFPDKQLAFAEVRRVLAPDGRFAFSTWAPLETHAFQAAVHAAVVRVFPDDTPVFLAAVPHGYADRDEFVRELRLAGYDRVDVESVTLHGQANSAADIVTGYCLGTPLRAGIAARGDLAEITAAVVKEVEAQLGGGPVGGQMTAYLVEATSSEP